MLDVSNCLPVLHEPQYSLLGVSVPWYSQEQWWGWQVGRSRVLLSVFLKMFPFPQSPEASADCHDFSNVLRSNLAATSDNSLRTLRYILSGPIDLCAFRFLRWSIHPIFSYSWKHFAAPVPSCCPATWEVWEGRLPLKTEARKLLTIATETLLFTLCVLC